MKAKLIGWKFDDIRNPVVYDKVPSPKTQLERLKNHLCQTVIQMRAYYNKPRTDKVETWMQMQGILWVIDNIDKLMEENDE
jgi:hypothetical protein